MTARTGTDHQPGLVMALVVTLLCSACGAPEAGLSGPQLGEAPAANRQSVPKDAHLAALYRGSCATCHGVADSGAPATGDHAAWRPRLAKGADQLLAHTITGFNGMPAGGQCFSCTPDDYGRLIVFMAGRAQASGTARTP